MSRVFNILKHNNLRNALDSQYPPSKKVLEKMTPEQREKVTPLPIVPFKDLVELELGRKVEQIDSNTLQAMIDHYLSMFRTPESIGYAFESVKSLSIDPEPTRKIEQLSASIKNLKFDNLSPQEIELIKTTFGSNLVNLKELVFSKHNLKYDENLIALFKQRVNRNTIPNIAELYSRNKEQNESNSTILIISSQVRQDYVESAALIYNEFVEKCRGYGLIDTQIYWIITHGKDAAPEGLPFFDKTNINPEIIKQLLLENNTISTDIRNTNKNEFPSFLFSENVEGMKKQGFSDDVINSLLEIGKQIGGAIIRDEYLDSVNLSRFEIPEDPSNLIDGTWDPKLDLDQFQQKRINPANLRTLKALLEKGGYVVGGKVVKPLPNFLSENKSAFDLEGDESWEEVRSLYGQGLSLGENSADFPGGNYVERGLWYIASTVCKNKANLRTMILSSGAISENSDDGQEKLESDDKTSAKEKAQIDLLLDEEPLYDERYKDFNFIHDAKDQKRAVDMLRNMFGLEVVPSKMGIPALDDCNINVEGFQVDFIVICSALQNWISKQDSYHPVINEQVNFVGEYYGFNFDFKKSLRLFEDDGSFAEEVIDTDKNEVYNIQRIKHAQGLVMPDGSMAKVRLRRNPGDSEKDKVEFDAKLGTPIDAGSHYKIRTEWKKMTEDFVASITGNASIHIPADFTDRDVAQELNKCNIIYKWNGQVASNTPLSLINDHVKQCNDPECDSKKTSESGELNYFRTYNVQEAMVISKIVDFKVTHNLVPKLREEKRKTSILKEQFKKKIAEEMQTESNNLWSSISYKEFLDRFNSEYELGIRGFGRNEVFQYYSQKSALDAELIELRKSPEYSFEKEVSIRQSIKQLKDTYLSYFQKIFDSHSEDSNPESQFYKENLQKLEQLRLAVVSGQVKYTNQELSFVLNQLVQSYVPQVEAQKKKALNYFDLIRIAIKS